MSERRFSTMESSYPSWPNTPGIYMILNTINGHRYVGSAVNLRKRRNNHREDLRNKEHANQHLQRAYDFYGENAFQYFILEDIRDTHDLVPREQHYIDTLQPEYNISPIAGSRLGSTHSIETRKRLSAINTGVIRGPHSVLHNERIAEANRGKKRTEEQIKNISEAHMGVSNGPHSALHTARIAEANKGKKRSEEYKKQLSARQKVNPASLEHCRKLAAAQKGVSRGPYSVEHCEAISASVKGKPKSPQHTAKATATKKRLAAERKQARIAQNQPPLFPEE